MKTNTELFKNALVYGLMLAGTMILFDLLKYTFDFSGMSVFIGIIAGLIMLAIYIGFFVWGGRKYRNRIHNGYISYGKALVFCLLMALFTILAITVYNLFFYYLFDPERAANEAQLAIYLIESNEYIPDEKKEDIIQGMTENASTGSLILRNLINGIVFSIVIAAISALFVRKKEKINDIVY